MQVFSTFEHTSYLELAISLLEEKGIDKERIFAVALNNRAEERRLFDTIHRADGVSLIDVAMALASAFAVIGASVGFILTWGPIYWGLIGAFTGFVVGFAIKFIYWKVGRKNQRLLLGKYSEVILIVECEDTQEELVEGILWDHLALGVAKVK
jgi:divalent metal cation (Fe/Co/Zn/Cd) transporter